MARGHLESVIVLALASLIGLLSPACAQDSPLVDYAKKASFDDVRFELNNAIIGRGLAIDLNGQIGRMLDRTGADVGSAKPIYAHAEYFAFCSAKYSRAMLEADAANLGLCPYIIYVYETVAEPGVTHVGYRRPPVSGSDASKAALSAIDKLLDGIVKEAVK